MSHQQSHQFNASLTPLVQVKDLFLEIAAITTLSTSVFALLGSITIHPASATEVNTAAEETTVAEITVADSSNIASLCLKFASEEGL